MWIVQALDLESRNRKTLWSIPGDLHLDTITDYIQDPDRDKIYRCDWVLPVIDNGGF